MASKLVPRKGGVLVPKLHAKSVGAICAYCDTWEDHNKVIYIYGLGLLLKLKLMGICFTKKIQTAHTNVHCHNMIYSSRITRCWPLLVHGQPDSPVRRSYSLVLLGEPPFVIRPVTRSTTLSTRLATAVPAPTNTRLNMNSATNDRTMTTANVTQYVLTVYTPSSSLICTEK